MSQLIHFHEPLIAQIRFNGCLAAVAVLDGNLAVLNSLVVAEFFHLRHDRFASVIAVEALEVAANSLANDYFAEEPIYVVNDDDLRSRIAGAYLTAIEVDPHALVLRFGSTADPEVAATDG